MKCIGEHGAGAAPAFHDLIVAVVLGENGWPPIAVICEEAKGILRAGVDDALGLDVYLTHGCSPMGSRRSGSRDMGANRVPGEMGPICPLLSTRPACGGAGASWRRRPCWMLTSGHWMLCDVRTAWN